MKPFIERFLADHPRRDAVARISSDEERDKRTRHDSDQTVYAAEQRTEQRAARHDGNGARDRQHDDL